MAWSPLSPDFPHWEQRGVLHAVSPAKSSWLASAAPSLGAFMLAISISHQSGFLQLISVFRPVPQTVLDPICLGVSSSCPTTVSGLSVSVCPSHDRPTLIQFSFCVSPRLVIFAAGSPPPHFLWL